MEMLGHHHVTDHDEPILWPGALQHTQEQIAALAASKLWAALITTTGYEV